MFERFTEKSIKCIMLAQEESRRLGHNFVGTEQILLGLIGEGTGVAAKSLKSHGVNLKDARIEVEKIIGRGSGHVATEIPFTPRAKKVLELSLEEARNLEHNYIGTEHLLLGLVREGEGVAARVLENLGVNLNKIRFLALGMIGEVAEEASSIDAEIEMARDPAELKLKLDQVLKDKLAAISTQNFDAAKLSHRRELRIQDRLEELFQLPSVSRELGQVLEAKDAAVRDKNFDRAGELRDRELEIKGEIKAIVQARQEANPASPTSNKTKDLTNSTQLKEQST